MSRPTVHWQPPMREGVSASRVAMGVGPALAVLDFLAQRLPAVPREAWRARLVAGEVMDARGRPVAPDARCECHGILWYWRTLDTAEPDLPLVHEILHQDERLVVADKPHFLSMTPKGRWLQQTLLVRLKRETGIETLVPVHRLDRETAGVVMFAVRPQDRHAYQSLFRDRRVRKVYEAVAPWRPDLPLPLERHTRLEERDDAFMQMEERPGEPNARTRVELIARVSEERAHYRLLPETGRKHQLRAHMNALGLPIVGDRIYPELWPHERAATDVSRPLQLLARSIEFVDPVSGEPRRFESRQRLEGAHPGQVLHATHAAMDPWA